MEKRRRAFVGASTEGIGFAIAKSLSDVGVEVIINGRDEQRNLAAARSIKETTGNDVAIWTGDVTRLDCASEIVESFGAIDILIANTPGPPLDFEVTNRKQSLLEAFERNMVSVALLVDAVLPAMERNKFGRIISILSTSAVRPIPGLDSSAAARSGLVAALRSLALKYAPHNITINHVLPGPIETERTKNFIREVEQLSTITAAGQLNTSQLANSIPAKRLGRPSEVAALCTFLSSELSGYITAQQICVDGGLTI